MLARLCSIMIAASWPKSPPGPPYSSGMDGQSSPSAPASCQISRSIWPCLRHFSNFGAHSFVMNWAVMSDNMRCSSVIQPEFAEILSFILVSSPEVSAFAVVDLGVEQPQAGRQVLLVRDRVEVLEQEGQCLALVETGLGREAF